MVKLDNIQLPKDFLKEEIREGYTVSAHMKELWAVELDLLAKFMQVADKYHLTWWADAGTILGAVRHKGMIPWDDDIDLMMPREDYNKLCKIAPKEFTYPYFWQTEETDPRFYCEHAHLRNSETIAYVTGPGREMVDYEKMENVLAKIVQEEGYIPYNHGIFIDIFPIDSIPDDDQELSTYIANIDTNLKRAELFNNSKFNKPLSSTSVFKIVKRLVKKIILGNIIITHYQNKKTERIKQAYNKNGSSRVAKVLVRGGFQSRRIWKQEWLSGSSICLPFEFLRLPVPSGYIHILDTFYGDWHTIRRGTASHGHVLFDTSKSYNDYLNALKQ